MKHYIEKGTKSDFWTEQLPDGISLLRKWDKITLILAAVSLLFSIIYMGYIQSQGKSPLYEVLPTLIIPFIVCGLTFYLRSKSWVLLIIGLIFLAIYFVDIPYSSYAVFGLLLFVGIAGVVTIIESLQRLIFFGTLHRLEYVNVKKNLTILDRAVAFIFNVPDDIDTRNLTLNSDLVRTGIPWKDMFSSIILGLSVGMFIWIYISMNPMLGDLSREDNLPIYVYALIMYVPVLVLPWSIFKSLNVRISTNYRDFKIYNGIVATIQRMAIPVFAGLVYILLALSTNTQSVLYFILTSLIMIVMIICITSVVYYTFFERSVVNDILSKWKLFRPVSIFATIKDAEESEINSSDVPGTPIRDMNSFDTNIYRK